MSLRGWLPVGMVAVAPTFSFVHRDVMTTGIEVTQGVQKTVTQYYDASNELDPDSCSSQVSLPARDTSIAGIGTPLTYDGVRLAENRRTVVRVFAHPRFANPFKPVAFTVEDVPAVLYGTRDGAALPGSPLYAEEGPRDLPAELASFTTCLDRADPKGAFTFTLPQSWLHGTITLEARTIPDRYLFGFGGECETKYCAQDNALKLRGVRFEPTGYVTVTPVALVYQDPNTNTQVWPPPPAKMLADPSYDAPTELRYDGGDDETYAGVVSIDDEVFDPDYATNTQDHRRAQCDDISDALQEWADDNPHGDITFGAFNTQNVICLGLSGGTLDDKYAYPVVNPDSLSHEMGHNFGRMHADPVGGGCGGEGEAWPPDQRGEMHGIGTDTRPGSGAGNGIYGIVVHRKLTPGDPFGTGQDATIYDLMSYCGAPGTRNKLSDRGWDEAFAGVLDFLDKYHASRVGTAPRAEPEPAPAATPVLRVRVVADGDSARILGVRRLVGARPLLDGTSLFTADFKSADGTVLGSVPMTGRTRDLHDNTLPRVLGADFPVGETQVKRVVIRRGDVVVATRVRSAHAPMVALTAPADGTTIPASADTVGVEWTATDADPGRLRVGIDYSRTAGKSWRHVFTGPNTGTVLLPRRLFAGADDARLRVRVSDGFNQNAVVSGKLAVQALRPVLRTTLPAAGLRARPDTLLNLQAFGSDGAGGALQPEQVTWYDRGKVIARGLTLARRLTPGKHELKVVAQASAGLVTQSLGSILVAALPAARVLTFRGPKHLPKTARTVRFSIATTSAAKLSDGRRVFKVGPRPRKVTFRIAPGSKDLELPLTIAAHGKTTHTTVVVARG